MCKPLDLPVLSAPLTLHFQASFLFAVPILIVLRRFQQESQGDERFVEICRLLPSEALSGRHIKAVMNGAFAPDASLQKDFKPAIHSGCA